MTEEARISTPREVLLASFKRLETKIEEEVRIMKKEKNIFPEVSLKELEENQGRFPSSVRDKIRKRGCVIVRNVIPREEVEEIHQELKEYMLRNGENPGDRNKTFYEIYYSKAQVNYQVKWQNLH